jgi:squalene synthase HpnC
MLRRMRHRTPNALADRHSVGVPRVDASWGEGYPLRQGEQPVDEIETPSGKSAGDENFPVGSWLLPARLRQHVAAFYQFARGADDIADNPDLTPQVKVAQLDRLAMTLGGTMTDDHPAGIAEKMRASLTATGVTDQHCLDLLDAFRQDATQSRYEDWEELMVYCARSADPVGRYLLDLHGENPADYAASDPLCSALQVINHLQDAKEDYRTLDRVYVPLDWMTAEGLDVAALDSAVSDARLRGVLNQCLDRVDALLDQAKPLPLLLRSGRLALESAAILSLARDLAAALRTQDPIAVRVAHGRTGFIVHATAGVLGALVRRALPGRPASRVAAPPR